MRAPLLVLHFLALCYCQGNFPWFSFGQPYFPEAYYDPSDLLTSSADLTPVAKFHDVPFVSPTASECALVLDRPQVNPRSSFGKLQYTTSDHPSYINHANVFETYPQGPNPKDLSIGPSYTEYRVEQHPFWSFYRRKRSIIPKSVCITYNDVNLAYKEAADKSACRVSKKPAGEESTVVDITKAGDCIAEVGKILAKRFELTSDEIINGLPLIDTTRTSIYPVCTGNIKPKPCTAERFSTISGACNNLQNSYWGANRTPFSRLLPPVYSDGFGEFRKSVENNEELPLPRKISSELHNDEQHPDLHLAQMFMEFGQVLAHDLTFASPTLENNLDFKCCGLESSDQSNKNCLPIKIPENDPFHGTAGRTCMEFKRTFAGQLEKCSLGPREQIQDLTHMIDGNFVYASTTKKSIELRTLKDGKLKTSLPESFRRNGLKPILPPRTKLPDKGCIGRNRTNNLFCFEAGDGRLNENILMVALHTVFLREHNRIVETLKELNPKWSDDRLFQEGRKIFIGMYQHIVYNEYVPVVIGLKELHKWNLTLSAGYWNGYNNNVNLAVANSFMSASFRFSHSNIDNKVERYNKQHQKIVSHDLREFFRRPFAFYEAGIVDEFILGLVDQAIQDTDAFMGSEVTNHLFQKPKQSFGMDLASINIKRGRDHGLPGYNAYRELCGLPRIKTFQELGAIFQNNTAVKFAKLYKHVDDIDLWSAGISEIHIPDAVVGPTFACLIGRQFSDLRRGDRFWYENPGWPSSFTPEQLRELKKVTMAKIVCDNSDDIDTIQLFTMELADDERNPRYSCENIPGVDLSYWKESSSPNVFFDYYDY